MPSRDSRTIEASRTISASAERIFDHLSRPDRHPALDDTGMVRSAVDHRPVTAVGEIFVMNMHSAANGDYQVENHVVVFELDRAIGWAPASPGDPPAGHTFTWRLTPVDRTTTVVTQTYDWTRFTHLDHLDDLPVVSPDQLRTSLDRLADLVEQEDF